MAVMKSLWASIQGDPVFMRRVNGWLTIFWILMIPFSIFFGLLSSVSYVSALSLWALVSGHWSAWQAARVEVEQMAEAKDLAENPIEKRVVEKLIEQTDVAPASGDSTPERTISFRRLLWRIVFACHGTEQHLASARASLSRQMSWPFLTSRPGRVFNWAA